MDTIVELNHPKDEVEKIDKLKALVEKIRFCMMTTTKGDGELHSRPMSFLEWGEDGDLLFFTSATSTAFREMKLQTLINLSFCEPTKNVYVSLLGQAKVLNDPTLKERLFSPIMQNWFPGGAADPNLRLVAITPRSAEYWDGLSGLSLLLSLAKERITKNAQPLGQHEYFQL